MLPIVGITMGDPAGIGPEVIVKALATGAPYEVCRPLVIGSISVMERDRRFVGKRAQLVRIDEPSRLDEMEFTADRIVVLEVGGLEGSKVAYGRLSIPAGRFAARCVEKAVRLALDDRIDAITTAPLNKAALHMAGYPFQGHTEFLAHLCGVEKPVMMLAGDILRVTFVTTHLPLRDVPDRVTFGEVLDTIRITHRGLQMMGMDKPRIAVAALNPHAGDGGVFGDEDDRIIRPALVQAREDGIDVDGPFPADTIFVREKLDEWDAIVTMYHDQGSIPVKMLEFDRVVNITLGLPVIRTSVGHGTAFDIAGKGIADERNMISAIGMAARLAKSRS